MAPAAEKLKSHLQAISWTVPAVPVLHNADVATHEDAAGIIDALARQLFQPVRWIETVQQLRAQGVTRVIECGPGKVLAGLCKRIDPDIECLPVFDTASLATALGAKP
jgi:[acyl-carrier-protein] S-malonyltransferase